MIFIVRASTPAAQSSPAVLCAAPRAAGRDYSKRKPDRFPVGLLPTNNWLHACCPLRNLLNSRSTDAENLQSAVSFGQLSYINHNTVFNKLCFAFIRNKPLSPLYFRLSQSAVSRIKELFKRIIRRDAAIYRISLTYAADIFAQISIFFFIWHSLKDEK